MISSYGHPTPSARVNLPVAVGHPITVFWPVYGLFLLPTICFSLLLNFLSFNFSLFLCSSPPFFTQFPILRLELRLPLCALSSTAPNTTYVSRILCGTRRRSTEHPRQRITTRHSKRRWTEKLTSTQHWSSAPSSAHHRIPSGETTSSTFSYGRKQRTLGMQNPWICRSLYQCDGGWQSAELWQSARLSKPWSLCMVGFLEVFNLHSTNRTRSREYQWIR